jgi:23S rRNA pseudouridine1911/1915/1917 synthase
MNDISETDTNSLSQRLDIYVSGQLSELSRASATKLIEQGKVTINGEIASKAKQKVRPTDQVVIDYDASKLTDYPDIELPIIYEDDDCVVINKPIGLLSHSKGAFNPEATVATWLSSKLYDLTGERAGIVHRLDRGTSGVMIAAKNQTALSWLQKQFSQRKVKKSYIAIISGTLEPKEAIIDMPIERNPKAPATFRVGSNGKPSITHYKVISAKGDYSLIELKPETGRTHQLRVHLKQLGHPIVGDTFYEGMPAKRLFLHARDLELTLPNRQRKIFTAPVPEEFNKFLENNND